MPGLRLDRTNHNRDDAWMSANGRRNSLVAIFCISSVSGAGSRGSRHVLLAGAQFWQSRHRRVKPPMPREIRTTREDREIKVPLEACRARICEILRCEQPTRSV